MYKLVEVPFTWRDNFSEIALEDFAMVQESLPYGVSQSIGMALAKLKMMEDQGMYPVEDEE